MSETEISSADLLKTAVVQEVQARQVLIDGVTERARRVLVELSGSWPYLEHYRHLSEQVLAFSVPECDSS